MNASENRVETELQGLTDIDLQMLQTRIDAELVRRSEQRVERMFQSFSHLNRKELAKLKEKLSYHLEQVATLERPIQLVQLTQAAAQAVTQTETPIETAMSDSTATIQAMSLVAEPQLAVVHTPDDTQLVQPDAVQAKSEPDSVEADSTLLQAAS